MKRIPIEDRPPEKDDFVWVFAIGVGAFVVFVFGILAALAIAT